MCVLNNNYRKRGHAYDYGEDWNRVNREEEKMPERGRVKK